MPLSSPWLGTGNPHLLYGNELCRLGHHWGLGVSVCVCDSDPPMKF